MVGVRLAPLLIQNFTDPATRVAFAVAILVLLVALGETFGVWCGRLLKVRIHNPKLAGVDNVLGAVHDASGGWNVPLAVMLVLTALQFPAALRAIR